MSLNINNQIINTFYKSKPLTKMNKQLFDNEDDADRYTIEPIMNPHLWSLYKKDAEPSTWHAEDISLADDIKDWNDPTKISPGEKHFIKMTLAFFACADNIVADNINQNFVKEIKIMEAQFFYDHQGFMERVHSEVYSKLVVTYISDAIERNHLFKSLHSIPVVKRKGEWATKYGDPAVASFAQRLVAFAIFEGVFFSGSFAAIFYFKKKGVLPGLCFSNDYIARDEAVHCRFACAIYSHLLEKLPEEAIHNMFNEAIQIESEFVAEALKIDLIGMNANLMTQYIKFVADYWIVELGYTKFFNVKNPFDWMHTISMQSKVNYFELRNAEYSKAGVGKKEDDMNYGLDDAF
jgi:ribonucleotide reductase beta subunit family protein with ferritin-like domain